MPTLPEPTAEEWEAFPCVSNHPDFNREPLNGEDPVKVQKDWGVYVEVLGADPSIYAHFIVVAGDLKKVATYIRHLISTWPKKPGAWT